MFLFITTLLLGATTMITETGIVANSVASNVQPQMNIQVVTTPILETSVTLEAQKNNLNEKIELVIREGKQLEQSCRWEQALRYFESAIRSAPTSEKLQAEYTRAKVLYDIHKRFSTDSYTKIVRGMNGKQVREFSDEFFSVCCNNYVESMTYNDIFYRTIRCMDIALGHESFCTHVLPNWRRRDIESFRTDLREIPRQNVVMSITELVNATMRVGRFFEEKFHESGAFIVMEGLLGYVVSLDAYSEVLLPMQSQALMDSVAGRMVGIGVEFDNVKGITYISDIYADSPAWNTDLQKGDMVLAINGTPIRNWSQEHVSEKMKGKMGELVRLTVQTGNTAPRVVEMYRKTVHFSSIAYSLILPESEGVGYVRLANFQSNTAYEMQEALKTLKMKGMRSLIVDLRGNTGGAMMSAIDLAKMFLKEGTILRECNGKKNQVYAAVDGGEWCDLPLVTLIDGKSASASEIFAGAIKGHNRGVLVGARTYGKGCSQRMLLLETSPFVIKLTCSNFFGPSGQNYNFVGIVPDYQVREAGKPIFEDLNDRRLQRNNTNYVRNAMTGKRDAILVAAMNVLVQ